MDAVNILLLPFLLAITFVVSVGVGRSLQLKKLHILLLLPYHTFFSLVYFAFAEQYGADASSYYDWALEGEFDWSPGVPFVTSFTGIFAFLMNMDKFNIYLVFNLLGLIGLLILARLVFHLWPNTNGAIRLMPYLIVLLPGLSFWSSAIGKDAPAFLAACLALYSFSDIKRKVSLFGVAVAIMFLVRPHMALLLLVAAGVTLFSVTRINLLVRATLLSAIVAAVLASVPFIQEYVGLEEVSEAEVSQYMVTRSLYNTEGGGGLDISEMPLPARLFTYLFRPLFFDGSGITGLAASVENLLLLALFIYTGKEIAHQIVTVAHPFVRFAAVYFVTGWLTLGMVTANMGIAVRQKTMILPAFLVLVAVAMGHIARRHGKGRVDINVVKSA